MKLEVEIGGSVRALEIDEAAGVFRLDLDGSVVEGEVLRPEPGAYTFYVGDRVVEARVTELAGTDVYRVTLGGESRELRVIDRKHRPAGHDGGAEGRQTLAAPMPGKVIDVLVAVGDAVEHGQGLVVVEAMKMQNEVRSPKAGVVAEVRVAAGEAVTAGQAMLVIE
jgi:biotin carboxyl carrier protein